jgi:hypothetical protein
MLPWGSPFQGIPAMSLIRAFTRIPLSRFPPRRFPARPAASQSIDRLPLGLILSLPHAATMDDATLLGFPHRTFPITFERAPDRAMCSPLAAPCIAASLPAILGQ